MHLSAVDYVIIAVYFVFVLGIGIFLKRKVKNTNDFLMSGRSIPLWITSLAFISANLGAQEVIGMAASGAKYGIMTAHFYWVGAIPAIVTVVLAIKGVLLPAAVLGAAVAAIAEGGRNGWDAALLDQVMLGVRARAESSTRVRLWFRRDEYFRQWAATNPSASEASARHPGNVP